MTDAIGQPIDIAATAAPASSGGPAVDALDHRRDVGRQPEHHDAGKGADPEPGADERRPQEVRGRSRVPRRGAR